MDREKRIANFFNEIGNANLDRAVQSTDWQNLIEDFFCYSAESDNEFDSEANDDEQTDNDTDLDEDRPSVIQDDRTISYLIVNEDSNEEFEKVALFK